MHFTRANSLHQQRLTDFYLYMTSQNQMKKGREGTKPRSSTLVSYPWVFTEDLTLSSARLKNHQWNQLVNLLTPLKKIFLPHLHYFLSLLHHLLSLQIINTCQQNTTLCGYKRGPELTWILGGSSLHSLKSMDVNKESLFPQISWLSSVSA